VVDLATFPDIEDLLTAHMTMPGGQAVTTKTPNDDWPGGAPSAFVRVERVGGIQASPITDAPTVVAEAWAKDEADAAALMKDLRRTLQELAGSTIGGHKVNDVTETGGVVNLPDPLKVYERYTVTVTINLRGALS